MLKAAYHSTPVLLEKCGIVDQIGCPPDAFFAVYGDPISAKKRGEWSVTADV